MVNIIAVSGVIFSMVLLTILFVLRRKSLDRYRRKMNTSVALSTMRRSVYCNVCSHVYNDKPFLIMGKKHRYDFLHRCKSCGNVQTFHTPSKDFIQFMEE